MHGRSGKFVHTRRRGLGQGGNTGIRDPLDSPVRLFFLPKLPLLFCSWIRFIIHDHDEITEQKFRIFVWHAVCDTVTQA
jgi:hypothetical protein